MTVRTVLAAVLLLAAGMLIGWQFEGFSPHGSMNSDGAQGPCAEGAQLSHWAAPMDPSYQRDAPGKSPMGMDLVPVCQGGAEADVTINPAIVQNLGLRTARVERRDLQREIAAVGVIGYDQNSFRMVHARAEGWLERLPIEAEGAAVVAGDMLYALFSPKLVAAEGEYLTASSSGRKGLMDAAADRLAALGYSGAQIAELRRRAKPAHQLNRLADADGVVAMLGVRQGQFISPGTHIMTLASLDTVWLLVDLMERHTSAIRQGLEATVSVDAWPGRQWRGRVDYVYPVLDAQTRTLKVRLVLDNADRALRPNLFARALIKAEAVPDALTVPASAVIRTGKGARVVKRVGEGGFDVVAVRTGIRTGSVLQVLEGLVAGDELVVSGQFLIDSEANLDAEALRLRATLPQGQATGFIRQLDGSAGTILLEHGPITALGPSGLSMQGMTMPFELGVEPAGFDVGEEVDVTIEQVEAGRYRITSMSLHGGRDGAGDPARSLQSPRGHSPGNAVMGHAKPVEPTSAQASESLTRGRVITVDREQRLITLEHDEIESLGMPGMTMAFPVAPELDLQSVKPGDVLHFGLQPRSMIIDQLEPRP